MESEFGHECSGHFQIVPSLSQICSSDDSASILSIFFPNRMGTSIEKKMDITSKVQFLLESMSSFGRFFCMRESEKSTIGLVDYVEFNSEFIFTNTIAVPKIKIIAACTNVTEAESLVARAHTQYNLIADLYGSGLSASAVHLCQMAQGLIHYKLLGSDINPLFLFFKDLLIKLPHPVYGFLLLDL